MQPKSTQWWRAITADVVEWRYGMDILASDEITPLEGSGYDQNATDRLVENTAQVVLDVTAKTHRQFSLNLRNSDGRYVPGPAGWPSSGSASAIASGLVWYSARYRPYIDLVYGLSATGAKQVDRTYLGVYVLINPQVQVKTVGSQTQLNLLDKSALLCKPNQVTDSTIPTYNKGGHTCGGYPAGSTFDSVMSDLATRGGVPASKQNFTPSSLTLPADYVMQEATEWWTHLQTLAGSMAHVIYFDGTGNLVRQPDPLLQNAPSVFTFQPGPLSTISQATRDTDLSKTYNHVVVTGGSSSTGTFRGEAQVQDPSSPYHHSQIGDRVVYVGKDGKLNDMTPDPTIGSNAQAQAKAQSYLARFIGQQEAVTIVGRNIPALEPYDRVTANIPLAGLNLDYMTQKITWNLGHRSGGGMQVEATRWFQIGS